VRNEGPFAAVKNLGLDTTGLANVCDADDDRLCRILFEGAPGTIANNTVISINQGASGCQEGNGIEVRNAPFGSGGSDLPVLTLRNVVTNYQKTGFVANGSVAATVIGSQVIGAGPIDYIAQNGIQIGFGTTVIVQENDGSGNDYTSGGIFGCGLLMLDADGVRLVQNVFHGNERDRCGFGGEGQFNPEP
jgi:hypothetical protein